METKDMVQFMVETVKAIDEDAFYERLKGAFEMFKPLFEKKGLDMPTVEYIREALVEAQLAVSLVQKKKAQEAKQKMPPDAIEYYNERKIKIKNENPDITDFLNNI